MAADPLRVLYCRGCSAPLNGYQSVCEYCGDHNDIDRELLPQDSVPDAPGPVRPCPVCATSLQRISIPVTEGNPITMDRCANCFGLFLDALQLELILNNTAKFSQTVDLGRLDDLGRQSGNQTEIVYRKCPVCSKLMNRENYGARSGVITDRCREHGIWLDAGELKRLVAWRNSGGHIVDSVRHQELERERLRREKAEKEKLARWNREADQRGGDGGWGNL